MLGSSKMVNYDQIYDCLERGWIVIVPNHRLCPQVDLLEGPIQDCRDLLAWIHDGGLQKALHSYPEFQYTVDLDHVFAFGVSSGGTLALCLVSNDSIPVKFGFDYDVRKMRNFADGNLLTPGLWSASSCGGYI